MMYNSKLVSCIIVDGKVLRENKEHVFIPFGSEYVIRLKNLNSERCSVKITIDGKSISGDRRIIVNPCNTVDIERFIEKTDTGNKFKFIERTNKIEEHIGIGDMDGIIQIDYQFEVPTPVYKPTLNALLYDDITSTFDSDSLDNKFKFEAPTEQYMLMKTMSFADVENENGITVRGSESKQKFTVIDEFELGSDRYSMVFRLVGKTNSISIAAPITNKTKVRCSSCGKVNDIFAKFCNECGTSLIKY